MAGGSISILRMSPASVTSIWYYSSDSAIGDEKVGVSTTDNGVKDSEVGAPLLKLIILVNILD